MRIDLLQKMLNNYCVGVEDSQATLHQKYNNTLCVKVVKDGQIKTDDVSSMLKEILWIPQIVFNLSIMDKTYAHRLEKTTNLEKIFAGVCLDGKVGLRMCFVDSAKPSNQPDCFNRRP